jgi:hypothetical protein
VVLVSTYGLLLPACLAQLQTVCSGTRCALVQPSPAGAHALQQVGVSLGAYAGLALALIVLTSAICFTVSGLIVWRKSDDWMALLVALSGVAVGTQYVPYLLESGSSAWQLIAIVMNGLDFGVVFLVFALFPNGRLVPRWTPWLVVAWLAATGALIVSYGLTGELRFSIYALVWLVLVAVFGGTQVYRYRLVSTPRERAQTRWVVFGIAGAVLLVVVVDVPTFLVPTLGQAGSPYWLVSALVYTLAPDLLAVCLGLAILRHRLYDIDVIIHRTLVYGAVTATLGATYFGSVVLLQAGFHALTGQGSAVAVVISTLAIFAMFQPVRSRVQAVVDRRFYRHKYDASRTLAAFGATVRAETDLDALRGRLVSVVEETMQPAHVSLWLPPRPHFRELGTSGPEQAEGGQAPAQT